MNREVEIIERARSVRDHLAMHFGTPCKFGEMSCEQIAAYVLTRWCAQRVRVLEDGENGAEVEA